METRKQCCLVAGSFLASFLGWTTSALRDGVVHGGLGPPISRTNSIYPIPHSRLSIQTALGCVKVTVNTD